jgi:nucleotide-binding universal stress UspA family protein
VPGDSGSPFDPFGTAVIAWNGSLEAANAVREAIGLIKMSSDVRVVRFTEDRQNAYPDTSLVEYLSRHGVHAALEARSSRNDYAADLVEYASAARAAYLVMGGYGHSRASEFVFGGVTRELLRECPITLVLGH